MTSPRQHHPLKALLFAAIFLAGNLVLPEADILLGHQLGSLENETRVHLEQLGGCRNHAEHCVLSRLLNDLGGQAPSSAGVAHAAVRSSLLPRSVDLRSATPRAQGHNLSRAPPASLL